MFQKEGCPKTGSLLDGKINLLDSTRPAMLTQEKGYSRNTILTECRNRLETKTDSMTNTECILVNITASKTKYKPLPEKPSPKKLNYI